MVLHLLGIEGGNGKRKTENLFEWEGKNGKVWHTPSASLVPLPQGDNGGRVFRVFGVFGIIRVIGVIGFRSPLTAHPLTVPSGTA